MDYELGEVLKQVRLSQHLTQHQLAENICTQSIISAIEHSHYTPNAQLMITLWQRLAIHTGQFCLATYFDISDNLKINRYVTQRFRQYDYYALHQFLICDDTVQNIQSARQLQAYYYYLGLIELQIGTDSHYVAQNFYLSLANAPHTRDLLTLTRLTHSTLAWLYAKDGLQQKARHQIKIALSNLVDNRYDENQNICFYLAALSHFQFHDLIGSMQFLNLGVHFSVANHSNYLFANYYYLIAQLARAQQQDQLKIETLHHQQFLTELFKESVYKDPE